MPEAAAGARLALPDHTARHARDVLRLRAGSAVRVFDGAGREFEATLESVSRQHVLARLLGPVRPRAESPLHLVLALPPLKGDRMEVVIQKATELGVAEVWPVITARTDTAGRPALHGSRQERWDKVASGAAEQCGRAVVPRIAPAMVLSQLLAAPFPGPRILFRESAGQPPLTRLEPTPRAAFALVGPAGGWEEREVSLARQAGFVTAGLGPRILRAETAAIAVAVFLQQLWGDLGLAARESR